MQCPVLRVHRGRTSFPDSRTRESFGQARLKPSGTATKTSPTFCSKTYPAHASLCQDYLPILHSVCPHELPLANFDPF